MSGIWPGALATATAALLVVYWIIPPVGIAIGNSAEAVPLAIFAGVGILMSVVAELYRRNRRKAAAYERQEALRASEERNQAMLREAEERRKVGEAVQRERERLTNVLNMLPAYVVLLSQDYHVPFANPYFEEHFGKSEGRRCYEYLFQRTEPCENCESYKVFQTGAPHHWEWLGPNGRYYSIHDMPFTDVDGSPVIMEMGIDITERKEAEERLRYVNRSLRALSDCNQLLLHAPDEQTLLEGVCRILVEHCGHALAWVGYPQQDEAKTVRVIAAQGVAKDYLEPGLVTWADEERGRGPTGTAIRTGKAVTLEDASTDPSFAPWREGALSRGFHSSVCLPVPIGESLPAGLTIYSTQRGAFEGEELQLLEELAQDLGYGIRMLRMRAEREQAEERLQEQQFYTRSLIEASLDPLVTISREGKITDVNQATETVTGATREELIGSDFCDYFTEPARARAGYEQVFADGYVQDYALAVRHASGRLTDVLYNATVFRNRKGEAEGVFAAARDITERKRAEERVVEQQFYTRSLIEASLDPLVTISREGKITDVDRATEVGDGSGAPAVDRQRFLRLLRRSATRRAPVMSGCSRTDLSKIIRWPSGTPQGGLPTCCTTPPCSRTRKGTLKGYSWRRRGYHRPQTGGAEAATIHAGIGAQQRGAAGLRLHRLARPAGAAAQGAGLRRSPEGALRQTTWTSSAGISWDACRTRRSGCRC